MTLGMLECPRHVSTLVLGNEEPAPTRDRAQCGVYIPRVLGKRAWDSFFLQAVSDDFLPKRAGQEQVERESL